MGRRSHYEVFIDKDLKIIVNRCDICSDRIMCSDDIEAQICRWEETNGSFEWENDKAGPRLLLCGYCQKENLIPAYPI